MPQAAGHFSAYPPRLQLWTETMDPGSPELFENMSRTIPFGSRIVFENLDLNIRNIRISIGQTHQEETAVHLALQTSHYLEAGGDSSFRPPLISQT